MNTTDMIKKTEEAEADALGRKIGTFETQIGRVTCWIHRHGSRTTGRNWERVDFYVEDESGFNKTKESDIKIRLAGVA